MVLCLCELYLSDEYDKGPYKPEIRCISPALLLIHIIELHKVTKYFMANITKPLMLILYFLVFRI